MLLFFSILSGGKTIWINVLRERTKKVLVLEVGEEKLRFAAPIPWINIPYTSQKCIDG